MLKDRIGVRKEAFFLSCAVNLQWSRRMAFVTARNLRSEPFLCRRRRFVVICDCCGWKV